MISESAFNKRLQSQIEYWNRQRKGGDSDFIRGIIYGIQDARTLVADAIVRAKRTEPSAIGGLDMQAAAELYVAIKYSLSMLEYGNKVGAIKRLKKAMLKVQPRVEVIQ
jgi:hypothetical protein